MVRYPEQGRKLTTRRQRAEATGFATEVDARAAIMEHAAGNSDDGYSMRQYPTGIFVLVSSETGSCWLSYKEG